MSILVITTITGTFRARAIPKCSLCSGKSLFVFEIRNTILAHSNETIVCGDHQKAVVGAAAQQSKDRGPKITFVTS